MADAPKHEFDWEELTAALLRARGESSGLWRLAVGFRFAAQHAELTVPESQSKVIFPAGVSAISGVALFEAAKLGPLVFDAAQLLTKFPLPSTAKAAAIIKKKTANAPVRKAAAKKTAGRKP